MNNFNLTEWALNNTGIVKFLIVLTMVAGVLSYRDLSRMEEPDFMLRQMIVTVAWPGASARQIEEQVTDKIEKKIQDAPGLDYVRSYSMAGKSIIFVNLKETVARKDVRPTYLEIRNMVNDIKLTLPSGVVGPFYNDRFDDVFGSIYAVTADGFSYEDMRVEAERIRHTLLALDDVSKVELVGVQPEQVTIEMNSSKLADLSIDPMLILNSVATQNAMKPAGMISTPTDDVYLRLSGVFEGMDDIRDLPVRILGRSLKLGDIAQVSRGYSDPPEPSMYFNGEPAIGICVSMKSGGNILKLGSSLGKTIAAIRQDLPVGFEIHQVSDQPRAVRESINKFIKTLFESIAIVLLVSLITLGLRTGVVVALSVPLVIAATFTGLKLVGMPMHNVSLGSLVIALGLLVDDAIIAVEMMTVKLEQGWDRFKAASYAYTVTAFPMLTGTLITCAGFIPIGFSHGLAAEYCGSMFWVLLISLSLSWIVSVMVVPVLGYRLIKVEVSASQQDVYDNRFYDAFRKLVVLCLNHRYKVLAVTLLCFTVSALSFPFLRQEFFPKSIRPELIVELYLPEGATIQATKAEAARFASRINGDNDIDRYTYYVGCGSPRFILSYEPVIARPNYAQFVIVAKGLDQRLKLEDKLRHLFSSDFANVRGHIQVIQIGPPDPYPVMIRVSGDDPARVRTLARMVGDQMANDRNLREVNYNWYQKTKTLRLEVDQDKARMLGIDNAALATSLQAQISGIPVSEFREGDKTIAIVFRLDHENRKSLANIGQLNVPIGNCRSVPLDQIARIKFSTEDGAIWRRNLKPTITVQAETAPGITGNDAVEKVYQKLKPLIEKLPRGYSIEIGGSAEKSVTATKLLMEPVPIMVVVIMLLLIFQLKNTTNMLLTLLTAPLGIIGVVVAFWFSGIPMGFMPMSALMALFGIIIRNSVILIDQIERQIQNGESVRDAIINATVYRFRPIMLTAAAAILGMIPLIFDQFWRGQAVTIASGLLGATILTLFVLPVMYAVCADAGITTSRRPG